MEWFYEWNGQSFGPVTEETLRMRIRNRVVTADCLIWCSAFGEEWKRLSDVAEFADDLHSVSDPNAELHPDIPNRELRSRARQKLAGVWGICVLAAFIAAIIYGITDATKIKIDLPDFGEFTNTNFSVNILDTLLAGPLAYGIARLHMCVTRGMKPMIEELFSGFQVFFKMLWTHLLKSAVILLWTLLLIVPGIMAYYSYSQVYYILADHPELSVREAMARSKQMMFGYRTKRFSLDFSFIGWSLLCVFTCGIGFFWLIPYMQVSYAYFYESVKRRA